MQIHHKTKAENKLYSLSQSWVQIFIGSIFINKNFKRERRKYEPSSNIRWKKFREHQIMKCQSDS